MRDERGIERRGEHLAGCVHDGSVDAVARLDERTTRDDDIERQVIHERCEELNVRGKITGRPCKVAQPRTDVIAGVGWARHLCQPMTCMALSRTACRALLLSFVAVAFAATAAAAQRMGSIAGTLTDSIRGAPLTDALLVITRERPAEPEFSRAVTGDKEGRYRLDSLVAGRYAITFNHALLDSLEIFLPPRLVDVPEGTSVRVDFGIPSGATLRRAACPGVDLGAGTGGVVGRLVDADNDRPLVGALVAVTWTDLAVDRETLRASATVRTGATRSDSTGVYRLCGVASGNPLAVQVQVAGRAGSAINIEVPDDIGFARLDLSFSASASRALDSLPAEVDSAVAAALPALTGNATLVGVITGAAGIPLVDVEVKVVDAGGVARTDSLGRFTLGALPPGSRVVEARRVGYLIGRRSVALGGGRTTRVQIRLDRIVSLDSIRVVAQRARYRDFEQRRRAGLGRYMTEEQIGARNAFDASDLVTFIPGFRVVGDGLDARVVSTRSRGFGGACAPNVVIDGMPHQEINLIKPRDIGAMEFYSDGAGGPPGMNKGCGVVVIWSKR